MTAIRSVSVVLCSVLFLAGCRGETQQGSSGASVVLELELAAASAIDEVAYVVTGEGMDPMGGVIDTSAPGSTASVELFGIPPRQDYLVTMSATTAGYAQYVPAGIPGLEPTPTCESQTESHYCAQTADSAKEPRLLFFQTALTDPAPTIVNPSE